MKLFGVTTTFNEEKIIPYVMPYIEHMGYDKLIVCDNESTDNTVELLKQYPFIEVRSYSSDGIFSEDKKMQAKVDVIGEILRGKNTLWDEKEYVWMTACDFDEVFYYTNMRNVVGNGLKVYLHRISDLGYNIINEEIVDIVSDSFPYMAEGDFIHNVVNKCAIKCPFEWNKPNLFRIDNLNRFWFSHGSHFGHFEFDNVPVKALNNTKNIFAFHLKYIDRKYIESRTNIMETERKKTDCYSVEKLPQEFEEIKFNSVPIRKYIENKLLNGIIPEINRVSIQ